MKVTEFKPLKKNSCLKKRKDDSFFTRENISQGSNFIQFVNVQVEQKTNYKFHENSKFFAAIFLVEIMKPAELIEEIKSNPNRRIEDFSLFKDELFGKQAPGKEQDEMHVD